jgi:thiol-disulfide isomerase/thioredoxin
VNIGKNTYNKFYDKYIEFMNKTPVIDVYYANWCVHCVRFMEKWDILKKEAEKNNITLNRYEESDNNDLMKKENIESFPTIKINSIVYNGPSEVEPIITAAKNPGNQQGGALDDEYYKIKYLKYKAKYLKLAMNHK